MDDLSESDRSPNPLAARVKALEAENLELARQLAKAPPAGPAQGTPIHFLRGAEKVCRPGTLASDGFVAQVPRPGGFVNFGLIEFGDPLGAPQRTQTVNGVETVVPHSFSTNRGYSAIGDPDTWHLASECPVQAPQAP